MDDAQVIPLDDGETVSVWIEDGCVVALRATAPGRLVLRAEGSEEADTFSTVLDRLDADHADITIHTGTGRPIAAFRLDTVEDLFGNCDGGWSSYLSVAQATALRDAIDRAIAAIDG